MTPSERVCRVHKPGCTGTVNGLPCAHDAVGWPRCVTYAEIPALLADELLATKALSAAWTLKSFADAAELPPETTYVHDRNRHAWERHEGRDAWMAVQYWPAGSYSTEELMAERGPLKAYVPVPAEPKPETHMTTAAYGHGIRRTT